MRVNCSGALEELLAERRAAARVVAGAAIRRLVAERLEGHVRRA